MRDLEVIDHDRRPADRVGDRVHFGEESATEKDGRTYRLKNFDHLSKPEIGELIQLCDRKIADYLSIRSDPWSHRRLSAGYVPGNIKYEVLKRAHDRCELCGVSKEVRALEVDHIIPRNKGGTDDISNFQALCYSCNATKRDRDDTDFRNMALDYKKRISDCAFCSLKPDRIIAETELCFAVRDAHPVSNLHTLIIPKRHVSDFFALYQPEINALYALLGQMRAEITERDSQVTGFNIGANVGADGGQTVFHAHMHVIARRHGDVGNPRGGVRCVIPGKQDY